MHLNSSQANQQQHAPAKVLQMQLIVHVEYVWSAEQRLLLLWL
jgi:hypothetical protein